MPRPPDTYTHSQFELVQPGTTNETVRCIHCKRWTGGLKVLNRKKDHLSRCPQYIAWRSSGQGQDIPPPNAYNKRDAIVLDDNDQYSSPYAPQYDAGPSFPVVPAAQATPTTPTTPKLRAADVSKAFNEYWDGASDQKCMRVRCKHCGFVRAKNTTRQVEHLLQCPDFLSSADGQAAIAETTFTPVLSASAGPNLPSEIWRGKAPNPNISVQKRGPGRPRHSGVAASTPLQTHAPSRPQPSLTTHLLTRDPAAFAAATRQPFLSHAGCGTLALTPLLHWLAQDSYVSRAFLAFIGTLIGKIRLPEAKNSQQNSAYRAADLLISAANNVRREIGFFEVTVQKYGLQIGGEDAKPPTKAYLDLLANASSPAASLLEGLVVLWATEHCYRTSWHYASTFTSTMSQSRSNYSLPSYLTDSQPGAGNPYGGAPGGGGEASDNSHVNALHDALIPNWTSAPFDKFVDACRAIVDELANAQTTGNGIEEMRRCESVFRQVVWLWERIWPRVDGMGEEDELAFDGGGGGGVRQPSRPGGPASNANGKGRATADHPRANGPGGQTDEDPVEIQDDEQRPAEQDAPGDEDSPYGGTGLDAVQAANEAS